MIAVLAIVFGWLLPRFIDYEQVWAALTELDGWEVVILVALGLGRIPTEALMYRAFLPGLALSRGIEAYLSSNLAGQVLPPPAPSVVQYGYFRGGGYTPEAAGLAALGSFVFPTVGRLLLPVVALVLLLIAGEVNRTIVWAGGISLAVALVSGIAAYWFLRTERSARWLGAKVQRPSRGSSSSSSAMPSKMAPDGRPDCVPTRWRSCARAGRWGRSGWRPTSSSRT